MQQSLVSTLLDAARQGQEAQVAHLLERGCAPDAADAEGRTPLMLAAAHGRQVGWAAAGRDELGMRCTAVLLLQQAGGVEGEPPC